MIYATLYLHKFSLTDPDGRSPVEVVGSNHAGGCAVRKRSLRRADYSSSGVLPTVMSRCV